MIVESNSSKKVVLFSSENIPHFHFDVKENQRNNDPNETVDPNEERHGRDRRVRNKKT